jgi:hypothetical protein
MGRVAEASPDWAGPRICRFSHRHVAPGGAEESGSVRSTAREVRMADLFVVVVALALVALLIASANSTQGLEAPSGSVSLSHLSHRWGGPGAIEVAQPGVPSRVSSAVSAVLSATGVSATAVSLILQYPTLSCNPTSALQESATASGPWATIGTGTFRANISLAYAPPGGAPSNSTTYWRLISAEAGSCSISLSSNVLAVRLSAAPTISVSAVSGGSATLTWNDPAPYGGDLIGGVYSLIELAGPDSGAIPSSGIVTLGDCSPWSRNTCTLTELDPGTRYSFIAQAVSSGKNSSGGYDIGVVNSTPVQFTTPAPGFFTSTTILAIEVILVAAVIATVPPLVFWWRRPPGQPPNPPTPESLPLPPAGP